MIKPILYVVACPSGDWGVLYFRSEVSNRKVYEGHDFYSGAVPAIVHMYGHNVEYGELTDEDECDGCTPDLITDCKSYVKQRSSDYGKAT